MTFAVVLEEGFVGQYRELRANDQRSARTVRDAVNALVNDPVPEGSVGWGATRFRRLHIGRWRVLYEVEGETIRIWSLGRTPSR